MKKLFITITAFFLGVILLNAQTTQVYPSDDMTTNSGNSAMFPTDGELWVANLAAMQNFHQTLLKFDLSAFDGQEVTSAKLHIYHFFQAPDGTPTPSKLYDITEDWDETSWPTDINISHGDTEYASPVFTTSLGWQEVDITSLVQEWIMANRENNGLVIIGDVGTKFAKFYSKEAADQTKRPYLEIEGTTSINSTNAYVDQVSVFPNPINQNGHIELNMLSSQAVYISIVNTLGMQVQEIANEILTVGNHRLTFARKQLQAGIYFISIKTNAGTINKKIIIK